MGHYILHSEWGKVAVKDADLLLLHHFLLRAAVEFLHEGRSGATELEQFLRQWENAGPGVWVGNDLGTYFSEHDAGTALFGDAILHAQALVSALGTTISLAYLRANVQREGLHWKSPQASVEVCERLAGLRALIP